MSKTYDPSPGEIDHEAILTMKMIDKLIAEFSERIKDVGKKNPPKADLVMAVQIAVLKAKARHLEILFGGPNIVFVGKMEADTLIVLMDRGREAFEAREQGGGLVVVPHGGPPIRRS